MVSSPIRTCIGCRQRADQGDLLRVTQVAGVLVPDTGSRLPGRGAYVHPDTACLELAVKRRAFGRALRASGELEVAAVREAIARQTAAGARLLPTTERIGSGSRMNTP